MVMQDLEAHIKANPKAERDAAVLRAAFDVVAQLREAGFTSGEYDLAPSFGGKSAALGKPPRVDMKMTYSR